MNTETIKITQIPLDQIIPSPLNPRKHFDETSIQELALSIANNGVLQPILVRRIEGDKYELIAGERRYRAVKSLYDDRWNTVIFSTDVSHIPAIIRDITPEESLDIQIIENLQRKDLHPMEEANGFYNLAMFNKLPAEEIAMRVGKSPSYIAQRIKLCDLIDPLQKFFYDGHLLVKDAMAISKFLVTDQQALFDSDIAEEEWESGETYSLTEWKVRKYQHALNNAPFDITSDELPPGTPACIECPHNSAVNTLLFPDQDNNPICLKSSCYHDKCNLSFQIQLDAAQEDPEVVLITGQYYPGEDTKELMKKVPGILDRNLYEELEEPEAPDRDEIIDWEEDEVEGEKEYQRALQDYKRELAEFHSCKDSGAYIKALKIGGDQKGTYTYVRLKRGAKTALKSTPADTKSADTLAEIHRLEAKERRSKELDDSKIWDQIKLLFKPIDNIKDFTDNNLTQEELTASAYAIFNKLGYNTRYALESYLCPDTKERKKKDLTCISALDEYFSDITQFGINELLRVFFLDTLPPQAIYGHIEGDAAIMKRVAEKYWPHKIATICKAQQEIADKRSARVHERITKLKATLPASKKKSTKKSSTKTAV